jgi:hypothetical protein
LNCTRNSEEESGDHLYELPLMSNIKIELEFDATKEMASE